MCKNKPQAFYQDKPHVIICEGIDDQKFLEAFLKYLKQTENLQADLFNILKMDGVENLIKAMKNFPQYENYEAMKSFLFIRDADKNVEHAINSLQQNIYKTWKINLDRIGNFVQNSEKKYFGFFIFPGLEEKGNYQNGTLEDLCSKIFSPNDNSDIADKISELVENHIQVVEKISDIKFKTRHKNRLHLLFGSTNDFVGDKLGEAAKKNAFDFSDAKLNYLKKKILQMSNF